MLITIVLIVAATGLLAWAWARGISSMKEKHPDYKGEDFLNWDNQIHTAGRDGWDDNLFHTENEI